MNDELQHLSRSFKTDAVHLLEKAKAAFNHSNLRKRTSFQAKLVVDAYMSIECSLKSLLCSKDADQEATVVYANIRKLGHDLTKLHKCVGVVPITREDEAILRAATKRGVHLRYSLDLFNLTTCDALTKDSVAFTIDEAYVQRFFAIADRLSKHAQTVHTSAFPSSEELITSKQIESYVRKLRKLEPRSK